MWKRPCNNLSHSESIKSNPIFHSINVESPGEVKLN